MTQGARYLGSLLAVIAATVLGLFAAWPIYQTPQLAVVAATGLVIGWGIAALGVRKLRLFTTALLLCVAFVLTIVVVAVPHTFATLLGSVAGSEQGFNGGPGIGTSGGLLTDITTDLTNGLASTVLGWKQLLTLTLPVGSYQAVLVPAYLVFLLTAFVAATIVLRAGRFAPAAALVLPAPVAFGTVFGASAVSAPLSIGPVIVTAPRELGLWLAAFALGAAWVWFAAGARRRRALRRGRIPGETRGVAGRTLRTLIGGATVVLALAAGVAVAPMLDSANRQVPRDRVDPEIVLRAQASPLASYRAAKRDATLDAELFTVSSDGTLPARLRLAVLDAYDGVEFRIGADSLGRFTRFPSAGRVSDPATITVNIGDAYNDIWVPTTTLGSVPTFTGSRATELADSFFVNRATESAIALPGGENTSGLEPGDGFQAVMSTTSSPALSGAPTSISPRFDVASMPELSTWLLLQDQPATADGLLELIERLRMRGYLSHSIGAAEGERLWIDRLAERYGTQFEPSVGGHSTSRLEQLFAQLNTQQRIAGDNHTPDELVAAIGDDEQFAAAAALIARVLGFESRVVLGVRLGDENAGASGVPEVSGVPACTSACTGEHLAAWVEVRGQEGVWVPIDVTPQLTMPPAGLEQGEQLPEFPTLPEERDAREVDPPLGFGERSDDTETVEETPPQQSALPVLRWAVLGGAILVLLLLPFLFLPTAKRLRELSRRREPDPELRALGAWQQMIDQAVDVGTVIDLNASRPQIAVVLGTAPAHWAAGTATKAVFAAQGVSEQEAEWMWVAVDADRAERSAKMSFWQRLRARYSLSSYRAKMVQRREPQQDSTANNVGQLSKGAEA